MLGGSRGIGAAIARRLGSDGAHVVLTNGRSREAAETLDVEIGADAVAADAARSGSVAEAVTAADPLDVSVANAGAFDVVPRG